MTTGPLDVDSRSADTAARECAQRVFDRPLLLEAGAGTGKTSTLVARIVVWCLGPGWERLEELARARAAERPAPEPSDDPQAAAVARDAIASEVLSRVAAITFTEAAAAEMAERTGETFAAVARGETRPGLLESALPEDRTERAARSRALLGALDHLAVRTIHAWCRGLLARHPLESGLHPAFQVDADMRLQAEVVREVVEESVRSAYASADSPLLQLALDGHGALEVEETLSALVSEGVAPARLRADPFSPERVEAHVAGLRSALDAVLDCDGGRLAGVPERAKKTHAALRGLEITQALVAAYKAGGLDALEALCEALAEAWQGSALSRLQEWSKGKLIGGETEALGESAGEFIDLAGALQSWLRALVDLSPRQLEVGRGALAPMLERVEAELRARGIATFASLLSGARELLETRPDVCRRVRLELDQLLVDEFQDTDNLQCSILRHLALSGPESERPGLFLVGDPKQSIYGWRSADLEAYDAMVREILQVGGEVHSLTQNFRSVPAILNEVERVIAPVMLRRPGLQPRFERLDVCQARAGDEGFRAGGRAPVEYWVSWGCERDGPDGAPDQPDRKSDRKPDRKSDRKREPKTDLKSSQATQIEARALAEDLSDLHESQGVAWRDMAVLFRGMGDLEDYLSALRDCGVPYAVERDRNYYRRREVIDAAAFVRCVLDPNDQLALLTTLRSPAVGVPDAALIPLWSRAFPARVANLYGADSVVVGESGEPGEPGELDQLGEIAREVAALLEGADERGEVPGLDRVRGWELSLCAMLEALASLRESFDRDAADVFVERLRTQSLLEVSEAARYLGAFRLANLDRFFRELRDGLVSGSDPQAVLRRLRSDIARGRDEEEQRPLGEAEDAVPVMTIHKAKGLDFEHVYLVQLHKRSRPNAPPATAVVERGGVCEYRLFGQATLGFEEARAAAARVEAAERVRTLYVAMTRAKRRLVLMGSWNASPAPIPYERAASHIDLLAGRLEPAAHRDSSGSESGARDTQPNTENVDLAVLMQSCVDEGVTFCDAAGVRWVFPALAAADSQSNSQTGRERASREPLALPSSSEIAREQVELLALRERAEARMQLRWGGPASRDAHARLADERSDPSAARASPPESSSAGLTRDGSMVAGVAIHRMLEDLDFEADPQEELSRQRALLEGRIARSGLAVQEVREVQGGGQPGRGENFRDAALARAHALLDRFAGGALAERLWAIAPHIVARELEVWLPGAAVSLSNAPEEPKAEEVGGPLRYVAGAIDLVYRDPAADGEWVVADYKSDRVLAPAEVQSRAQVYASQGAVYSQALQESLGLSRRPRFELWFLDADVIVVSDPPD